MNPRTSTARPGRDRRPSLETLEGRRLLSGSTIAHVSGAIPPVGNLNGAPSFAGPVTPSENLGPLKPDPGLVARVFAPIAYPATVSATVPTVTTGSGTSTAVINIPNPQPTSSELAREYFTAEFTGTYTVTPGHFAGQAATVKIATTTALHSNQFLHGKGQVIIETRGPARPPRSTGPPPSSPRTSSTAARPSSSTSKATRQTNPRPQHRRPSTTPTACRPTSSGSARRRQRHRLHRRHRLRPGLRLHGRRLHPRPPPRQGHRRPAAR